MSQSFYLETASNIMSRVRYGRLSTSLVYGEGFKFESSKPSLWSRIKKFLSKPPAPPVEVPPSTDFLTTYTSYSGADIVVSIGADVIGEMQEIAFQKINPMLAEELSASSTYADRRLIQEFPVVIVATYALFDKEAIKGFDGGEEVDITLTFANEYGQSSFQSFVGARVIAVLGGSSVDDITQERKVIMAARNVFPMEKSE